MNHPYDKEYYVKVLLPKQDIYSRLDRNKVYVNPIIRTVSQGSAVLDVASGASDIPARLLQAGYEVYACDVSKEFLKINKVKGVHYQIADMFDLSYPPHFFSAIVVKDIIEHYERKKIMTLLPMFDTFLKPGGVIVIGVPSKNIVTKIARLIRKISNKNYIAIDDTTDITHKHWYSENDLKELIAVSLPSYSILEITYLMHGVNNFPRLLIPFLHTFQKILHKNHNSFFSRILQKHFGFRIMIAFQKLMK